MVTAALPNSPSIRFANPAPCPKLLATDMFLSWNLLIVSNASSIVFFNPVGVKLKVFVIAVCKLATFFDSPSTALLVSSTIFSLVIMINIIYWIFLVLHVWYHTLLLPYL